MIRKINDQDYEQINKIGLEIKSGFDITNQYDPSHEEIFVYEDNIIKGFIQIAISYEVIDIVNIAVLEEYQHNNIATTLLDYVKETLKPERIMLEVRQSNTKAINFYTKNGFKTINERKNYYGNENALIMEVKL